MRQPSTFEQRQVLVGRGYNIMDLLAVDARTAEQLIRQTRHLDGSPLRSHVPTGDDKYSWETN